MDGKGRWVDNVMIERLWRTVNTKCMFKEFNCIKHLRSGQLGLVGFTIENAHTQLWWTYTQ